MEQKRKLKNYLLFPHIQFKLILAALGAVLISLAGAIYSVYASFNRLNEIGVKLNFAQDSGYFKILTAQQEMIYSNVAITSVIALFITISLITLISHKILGPFYRIKEFFKNYDKEANDQIQFREKDFLKELEENINKALK